MTLIPPQKNLHIFINIAMRLMEQRRTVLRQDIREANREFRTGKCHAATPAELMQEITE